MCLFGMWILAWRASLKGSMPGIPHRGWKWPGGGVPGQRGLPLCGQCPAPLFFLYLIPPHSFPRLACARQKRGSSCRGFPELPGGGGSHPSPPPAAPLFLSSRSSLPCFYIPSSLLFSPPLILPEGQRDWEESGSKPCSMQRRARAR